MTHTPGPWLQSSSEGDRAHYIVGLGGELIARILHHRPGSADRVPHDTVQSDNARLIAAAPALLEALQRIMLDDADKLNAKSELQVIRRIARAAIARAIGEHP